MTIELLMPRLAMSMEEGELIEWLAEDGAVVREGQPIYVIEGDKATQEIEAPAGGTLRHAATAGGGPYAVGARLGEIV